MKNQTKFNLKKMISLPEWKEKVADLIKHSIIDIIKYRINSNACENSYSIENEYENISHHSIKDEKETYIHEKKNDINKFQGTVNEYSGLQPNDYYNDNQKNIEDSLRNKMIEKISDGFLYLNFSDLDNFQHETLEYIITISILFRRKEIKFVIENWIFEVNLTEEINHEITKAKKSQKQINVDGLNLQKRIYINKKLDNFSRTVKSLLNFLPSIKLFHGNSFDFYLDFEINFEEISQKHKSFETKNNQSFKNKNDLRDQDINDNNKIINNKDLGFNKSNDPNTFKNDLDIFRMNSLRIKANQEIKKENTIIPIQRQIELIKCLTNSKKIFHIYKTSYTDKIGKVNLFIDYLDKSDVFLVEEEINKSISHLERINKRKRFLSENCNDYIGNVIKDVDINPSSNNKHENDKGDFSHDLFILKNLQCSFLVDCKNNSPKNNRVNEKVIKDNIKFPTKENNNNNLKKNNNLNSEIKNDFNQTTTNNQENNIGNQNFAINKTIKLFENILPNCSINNHQINNIEDDYKSIKGDKRISSKSEEKNHPKNSPKNNLTTNDRMIINFPIRDYLNENSSKNSTDYLNSDRTISTKSSNYNTVKNYFYEENQTLNKKALTSLQSLKNQLKEIHKIPKDDSISSSSFEEYIEESDDSSIELVIEGDEEKNKKSDSNNLSHFIIKMNKLKSLLNSNNTLKIDNESFNNFKKDRLCISNNNSHNI